MKKILTLALVGAMLTATGITAYAVPGNTTEVSYEVAPTYTVVIPESVALGDTAVTADIEATNVLLEDGKQIKVDLTDASNTASGSTFNAKNGDSAVTYTISAGDKAIAVNDTVATFTANGSKTLTFSAADKSGATVAGAHTETLTFTIAVEDAVYTPRTYNTLSSGDVLKPGDTIDSNTGYNFLDLGMSLTKYCTWTLVRADVTAGAGWWDDPTVTEKDDGAYYVIKGVDRDNGSTVYMVNNSPEGNLEGMIFSVTDTSDGVVLTQSGSSWTMAVHEP